MHAGEGWGHSGQGRISPKERFELSDNDKAEDSKYKSPEAGINLSCLSNTSS